MQGFITEHDDYRHRDTVRGLDDPRRIARRVLKQRKRGSGSVSFARDVGFRGVIVAAFAIAVVVLNLFTGGSTSA